jgi:hypothetical protein
MPIWQSREVRVRCNVFKLIKIDLKEHAFEADTFLEAVRRSINFPPTPSLLPT